LVACLRRRHACRKPRRRGAIATQGKLQNMVLVDQRPAEVESRLIAGHYEGDPIMGAGNRSVSFTIKQFPIGGTFQLHRYGLDRPLRSKSPGCSADSAAAGKKYKLHDLTLSA